MSAINSALQELSLDWNHYQMSKSGNFPPTQLWHLGLSQYQHITHRGGYGELVCTTWQSFGIDHEALLPSEENEIVVPQLIISLT